MSEERLDVAAPDGALIAVWREGVGAPLVMVHGSIADHTTFGSFISVLRDRFEVFALDRRGFGATPDGDDYALERDFEDVAAVVDAVADRTGQPVMLWGHSYGANCAMGAATLTRRISQLVLYEPSLGLQYPPGAVERVEAALERGDPEAAIVTVLVEVLEMTEEELDVFRANPLWPTRIAAAPTIPREIRVEEGWVYSPGQFDGIAAPILFLQGSESVPAVVEATARAAAAVDEARIQVLDGHGHFAHRTDPEMVAAILDESAAT